jgi:hypothetical protein
MPQIILDSAQIMSLVCQRIPAGMAEHMWMDFDQIGAFADAPSQVVNTVASELGSLNGTENNVR